MAVEPEIRVVVDLPEIFDADIVAVERIFLDATSLGDVVDIAFRREDARAVGLLAAAIDHDTMPSFGIQREFGIAPQFARIELAIACAQFHLVGAVGALGDQADDADAAIRSEEQAVAAAEYFDPFDHVRVDRRRSPNIFQRRATIVQRHAIKDDERVAIAAAVEANGIFALVRRIADIGALDEELGEFGKVAGTARGDRFGTDDLDIVAKGDGIGRHFGRFDALAGHDDR